MIPRRELYGRVVLKPPFTTPEERRRDIRKRRYARRMELAGIRKASIYRYLRRGFKSHWARAIEKEMQRMLWDLSYRMWRKYRREA